jgi:hypothetical protein
MNYKQIQEFRQQVYDLLNFAADATFELTDAVLTTRNAYSLAEFSLIILVERILPKQSHSKSQPLWLVWIGSEMPPMSEIWWQYLRRFAVDHWYRFLSSTTTLDAAST